MSLADRLVDLAEKALELSEANRYDPSQLNDPVAMQTDWGPLVSGGTSFRTRDFHQASPMQVEARRSTQILLVCVAIAAAGVGLFVFAKMSDVSPLVPILAGIGFLVAAWIVFSRSNKPLIFDKENNLFGIKQRQGAPEVLCRIDEIHAIQLIAESIGSHRRTKRRDSIHIGVRTTTGSDVTVSYSYELNLVLAEGRRVSVLDHGSLKHIRGDTNKLGEFLGVPVWDAI